MARHQFDCVCSECRPSGSRSSGDCPKGGNHCFCEYASPNYSQCSDDWGNPVPDYTKKCCKCGRTTP